MHEAWVGREQVSAVLLLGTPHPSRQFILAQVQDETLIPTPPPPRLGGPWLLLTLPRTALEGKHVCGTRQGVSGRGEGPNQRPLSRASQGEEEDRSVRPWVGVRDKGGLLVSRPGHNLFFVTWVGICVARSRAHGESLHWSPRLYEGNLLVSSQLPQVAEVLSRAV